MLPNSTDQTEDHDEEILVCPVSRWYFRRIGMMAALFAGLALYFLYDGAIGYPRTNWHADLFDAFEAGKKGETLDSLATSNPDFGHGREEPSELVAAHQAGANGGSWAAFAAKRHLGEARPDRHSQGSIRQQFVFAAALGILACVTVGVFVVQRKRCLRAGNDWLESPSGRRIRFAEVTGADFSKWDRGIAVLETLGTNGQKRRIRIDDYKFTGARKILERIRDARPELESGSWQKLNSPTSRETTPN